MKPERTQVTSNDRAEQDTANGAEEEKTDDADVETNAYVVQRLVAHRRRSGQLQYKVRWYGNWKEDDTYEPAHHIPPRFVARYWKRRN